MLMIALFFFVFFFFVFFVVTSSVTVHAFFDLVFLII